MFGILRMGIYSALAGAALATAGCALDSDPATTAPADEHERETASALGFGKKYRLQRVAEARGHSTPAGGGARWYMPTIVPDQDGDGANDIMVGQPYGVGATPGRQGAVRILSSANLAEIRVISPNDVDPTYEGTFGYAAHSLGDINFDGKTDFAIGSPVIRGRNPDDGTLDPAGYKNVGITWVARSRAADNGFDVDRYLGDDPTGFFGYWFAPVTIDLPRFFRHGPPGAWAGIQLPPLGIASSQPKFRAGRVWGIEPRTGTIAFKASDDPANNDTISERRGYFIAPTFDLNGNGITDFLSTANGQWAAGDPDVRRYAGRVYFHDGLTGQLIRAIEGAHDAQFLGYRSSAQPVDDLNNDGVDDFLIGSGQDGSVAGIAQAGVVYAISGRAIRSATDKVLKISDHPEIVLRTHAGTNAGALFGDTVTNLFDMDADGVDEYAIGSLGSHGAAGASTGAVYIYSGRTGAELQRLEGEIAGQFLGQQVIADRATGTLYLADTYFPEPGTGKSLGRVLAYRAVRIP